MNKEVLSVTKPFILGNGGSKRLKVWSNPILEKITPEGVIRFCADIVLINLSFVMSIIARLMWFIVFVPAAEINYRSTLLSYWQEYNDSAWLLTIICMAVFTLNGFYTQGRFYRGWLKLFVVAQAVTVAYLIFGAFTYLSQGIFFNFLKGYLNMPRGALMVMWGFTILFTVSARTWSLVWRRISRPDKQNANKQETPKVERVLVIGGAGYIGSALLPRLLEKGYQVRLLDLLLYGMDPIKPWENDPRVEIIRADFRQVDQVVSAMQGVDVVIHLGGLVGDPACAVDENLTMDINLMATRMIAEVAKGCDVRYFVFASTCSVYGSSQQVLDEHSAIKPMSLYARTKAASEKLLLQMADEHFAPVILRFSTVYGLSGRYRFDLVVNLLTAKAMMDREITIFGGNQWRSFVHVQDAARSIMHVLATPVDVVRGQIFNVGSDEQNYTIQKIGETIHSYVPDAAMINRGDHPDPCDYRVGFAKIRRLLHFTPEWTVKKGIEQVIEAIESGQVTDYKQPEYSNLKFLTQEGITLLDRHENDWAARMLEDMIGTEHP